MSNRMLRAMYLGMVKARDQRARVLGAGSGARQARTDRGDVACFATGLVGLRRADLVFGCREDGVVEALRGSGSLPCVADGVGRLYAAAGAAMSFAKGSKRVAMAFFERHEVGGTAWAEGLRVAAELPLVLVVLPRWKGKEREDLCAESRKIGVPGIAVDAGDAIALYRVAQESLVRARMGGGVALLEGVYFRLDGEPVGRTADPGKTLAEYLLRRGVASEGWLQRVDSSGGVARGMGADAWV